jgi:glutathione peroxidase
MKLVAIVALAVTGCATQAAEGPGAYAFKVKGIDGKEIDLAQYKGKVVLFVNVASECGYTDQYKGLQKLYADHEKAGLVIIGVPSNEFGGQEPGTNEQIAKFCEKNYKTTFPMLAKTTVNGDSAIPLYKFLTSKQTLYGGAVAWNFEKFLVNRDGQIIGRFKSDIEPDDAGLARSIKTALESK